MTPRNVRRIAFVTATTTQRTTMSKQRAKGTAAETAVVRYLRDHGFPHAERRALHGTADKGDITGCGPVVFEVKNHKQLSLAEWVKELEAEMVNAGVDVGAVIAKKRGTTDPAEWYAILPTRILVSLLIEAGY
jgi:hypothetical protein